VVLSRRADRRGRGGRARRGPTAGQATAIPERVLVIVLRRIASATPLSALDLTNPLGHEQRDVIRHEAFDNAQAGVAERGQSRNTRLVKGKEGNG
jgi:hypothetical protein